MEWVADTTCCYEHKNFLECKHSDKFLHSHQDLPLESYHSILSKKHRYRLILRLRSGTKISELTE